MKILFFFMHRTDAIFSNVNQQFYINGCKPLPVNITPHNIRGMFWVKYEFSSVSNIFGLFVIYHRK